MQMNNLEMSHVRLFDAAALLDELDNTPGDTYDLAVNAGIAARESLDQGRYVVGDIAVHLGKRYGDDVVGRFAEAINCRTASVREYRRVCRYWSRPARAELFDEMPGLSYSMIRTSTRFKDPAQALDFLRLCVDSDWKCERAHEEANKLLGKETQEMFKVLDMTLSGAALEALRLNVSDINPAGKYRLVGYQFSEVTHEKQT
jgi:hypothetical protein